MTWPRRRTGTIAAVVVAVLLVVAAFGVTLFVARGDDDPEGPSDATSTATASTGGDVEGDGYTYDLPNDSWTEATDEAADLDAPTIDTVVVLGSSIELSQSNIIVEALGDGGVGGA